ncbi:MAG: hypothetical protein KGL42_17485, partial [Betaproteobacteria bacterium]|nr:hypothetical protein [Betaproteobacteria bacterium]
MATTQDIEAGLSPGGVAPIDFGPPTPPEPPSVQVVDRQDYWQQQKDAYQQQYNYPDTRVGAPVQPPDPFMVTQQDPRWGQLDQGPSFRDINNVPVASGALAEEPAPLPPYWQQIHDIEANRNPYTVDPSQRLAQVQGAIGQSAGAVENLFNAPAQIGAQYGAPVGRALGQNALYGNETTGNIGEAGGRFVGSAAGTALAFAAAGELGVPVKVLEAYFAGEGGLQTKDALQAYQSGESSGLETVGKIALAAPNFIPILMAARGPLGEAIRSERGQAMISKLNEEGGQMRLPGGGDEPPKVPPEGDPAAPVEPAAAEAEGAQVPAELGMAMTPLGTQSVVEQAAHSVSDPNISQSLMDISGGSEPPRLTASMTDSNGVPLPQTKLPQDMTVLGKVVRYIQRQLQWEADPKAITTAKKEAA